MIWEVAKGKSFNSPRGVLVHDNDLYDWVVNNGNEPIGISVFAYNDQDRERMETESPSTWFNQAYCPWVPIDIDKADNSDEATQTTAREVVKQLQDEFGLCDHNIKAYFSGTGYHLMIHGDCIGLPKSHQDLPYVVKSTMESVFKRINMWEIIDSHVYMRTSIIRAPFSINPKSGLYKTPITLHELFNKTPAEIKELSKAQRLDFPWEPEYSGDGELKQFLNLKVPPIPAYSKVVEPRTNYSCIYKMLEDGPIKGSRNNTALVLASHLMRSGVPSYLAKQLLLIWNNKSLDERIIHEKVEHVYEKKYKYGCSNKLMRERCSTRCVHYSKQLVSAGAKQTFEDVLNNAKKRDFLKELKEGLRLGELIGFKNPEDFVVTRGEIVTLLAPTKAGKSTLMKNIILGVNIATGTSLKPESSLRRTLYYTAEQAAEHFLVTCCQILEGVSKDVAMRNKDALLDKWKSRLSHIMPIDIMPDMSGLREHIAMYDPELIVIDTVDHFVEDKSNEHLGIKNMMIAIQRITSETGIPFALVSQIKRSSAEQGLLELFSGKGSGSIENQSRKVFGINATKDPKIKHIKILADTYGVVPEEEVQVYIERSLRFRKIGISV